MLVRAAQSAGVCVFMNASVSVCICVYVKILA